MWKYILLTIKEMIKISDSDRITQIYDMVTQLVKIVGNSTAAIEELRAGQSEIMADVAALKVGQQRLEQSQLRLEENQHILFGNQKTLEAKIDKLTAVQSQQSGMIDILASRSIGYEAEIRSIKSGKSLQQFEEGSQLKPLLDNY